MFLNGPVRKTPRPFPPEGADPVRLAKMLARPAPERRLVILFTPRSSSSRLTEILGDTGAMGDPGESFNPSFVPKIAASVGAGTMEEYVEAVMRVRSRGGIFGCEVTYPQMLAGFGEEAVFLRLVRPTDWAWLIRRDIVAQAVSSVRQIATQQAHDTGLDPEEVARADAGFAYDPRRIARQMQRFRNDERRVEAMLARAGARPLRLSYERLVAMDPPDVAALFARHLGIALPEGVAYAARHRKIGGARSEDYAERFRREHRWLVRRTEWSRRGLLRKLDEAGG